MSAAAVQEQEADNILGTLCSGAKFIGAPNLLEYFDPNPDDNGDYLLNGQKAKITGDTFLASGREGSVHRLELTTEDGKKALFAVKVTDNPDDLHEVEVIKEHAEVLSCPGVIPMKIGQHKGKTAIFMPLADGNLAEFVGGLQHKQAEVVINVVKDILLCMDEQGMYYFDIKVDNIVFHCKDGKHITLYLADMSSIILNTEEEYIASYPLPVDARGDMSEGSYALQGYVYIMTESPKQTSELAHKIYSYQLSCLYVFLITGIKPPTYRESQSLREHAMYYAKLHDFIGRTADKVPGGPENKYMQILHTVYTDTKTLGKWSLDAVPLLSEL